MTSGSSSTSQSHSAAGSCNFILLLLSLSFLLGILPAPCDCALQCHRRSDHALLLPNNTLAFNAYNYGRIGNWILSAANALLLGEERHCNVILPSRIDEIGFNSPCSAFVHPNHHNCVDSFGMKAGHVIVATSYDFFMPLPDDQVSFTSTQMRLLNLYLASNQTHAYGVPCSSVPRTDVAIHLRAGDLVKGEFDQKGRWVSQWRENGLYTPYPVSFYTKALSSVPLNHSVGVFTQTKGNGVHPALSVMKHTALFRPMIICVNKPLFHDLLLLSCAKKVITSGGTFHVAYHHHESQVLERFISDPTLPLPCRGVREYRYHLLEEDVMKEYRDEYHRAHSQVHSQ